MGKIVRAEGRTMKDLQSLATEELCKIFIELREQGTGRFGAKYLATKVREEKRRNLLMFLCPALVELACEIVNKMYTKPNDLKMGFYMNEEFGTYEFSIYKPKKKSISE